MIFFLGFFYQVPYPVAMFPLNARYGTKEINNRVAKGVTSGVTLSSGLVRIVRNFQQLYRDS